MKKIVIIVVALVVLLGGGAGAYFFLAKDEAPAAEGEQAAESAPVEKEPEPIYFELRPEFIINFEHRGSTRYLQLSMQIMAHEQGVIDKVEANMPAVRNTLIMLLSGQDFDALATQEGKEALRDQVLAATNETVKYADGEGVQAVYFTAFVMQ